jgi:hypothetical protein
MTMIMSCQRLLLLVLLSFLSFVVIAVSGNDTTDFDGAADPAAVPVCADRPTAITTGYPDMLHEIFHVLSTALRHILDYLGGKA